MYSVAVCDKLFIFFLLKSKFNNRVMSKDKQNCYYHSSDLICLRQNDELKDCQITDVYMDNKSFKMLKEENKEELWQRGHWDAIIDGWEGVKLSSDL